MLSSRVPGPCQQEPCWPLSPPGAGQPAGRAAEGGETLFHMERAAPLQGQHADFGWFPVLTARWRRPWQAVQPSRAAVAFRQGKLEPPDAVELLTATWPCCGVRLPLLLTLRAKLNLLLLSEAPSKSHFHVATGYSLLDSACWTVPQERSKASVQRMG